METFNARIISAYIKFERDVFITAGLVVGGDGWGQGFGGSLLVNKHLGFNEKSGWGMEYISEIMETVGVEEWSELQGKYIRIKRKSIQDKIDSIGNIVEDKWFSPSVLADKWKLDDKAQHE